ncbi:MAG: efflux transporter outer membrane subunit [Burkholderiaceae bacterium]|nr:efflux transporter outer membrane subunit [Burkholderiaceae bacterium]
MVGPDYHLPQDAALNRPAAQAPFVAAGEASFRNASLPTKWWRLYDDPELDALIEKAFVANTDLRIASANLARARAMLEEARMGETPAVSVSAAPSYGRASAAAKGLANPLADGWSHDGGLGVSYQLDLFGKIARGIEAAGADTGVAQAAYDLTRVTVAAETAKAYAEACTSVQQMRTAEHSIRLQRQFVQSTEQLTRLGRGTTLDIARTNAQLEKLRAALPPLQAQQKSALYRLAVLTGDVPTALVNTIGKCERAPQIAQPIPVGDGAGLLRRRPDIRQAERSLAAATARIGVATADLYPSINIGASVGSTGPMSALGDVNAFRWGIGPLISWTLPNTSIARSRISQAEASTQAALAKFDGTVLNALRETENALTAYARELDRNALLKAARDQSASAAQQAQRLYRAGRTDFLTALDAQRTLASDDSALAASTAKLASDQIAVFLALGGGWEQEIARAGNGRPERK